MDESVHAPSESPLNQAAQGVDCFLSFALNVRASNPFSSVGDGPAPHLSPRSLSNPAFLDPGDNLGVEIVTILRQRRVSPENVISIRQRLFRILFVVFVEHLIERDQLAGD